MVKKKESRFMSHQPLRFGIGTAQQNVSFEELRSIWIEADREPLVEDVWLFDHLIALGDDPTLSIPEGWCLLAALAAQTNRVRIGVLVTSNTFRHPAILAKQAATVDQVSGGRLNFGIGAGWNEREHRAYGIPFPAPPERVKRLDEACAIIRRLWTEPAPSFTGQYYQIEQAYCEPKPLQRPHPPITIGAAGEQRMLRIVARHADRWSAMAASPEEFRRKSAVLDQHCAEIGRDLNAIVRSAMIMVNRGGFDPTQVYQAARQYRDAGATHVTLLLSAPYPEGIVPQLVEQVIAPLRREAER